MQRIFKGVWIAGVMVFLQIAPAVAQTAKPFVSCLIDGRKREWTEKVSAVVGADHGLVISAGNGEQGPHLSIQLPKASPGTFTIATAPGARIHYARSLSLDLRDHFQAGREKSNARLSITLEKLGEVGSPVEGLFAAVVENQHGEKIEILEGKFSLIRTEPPKGPKPEAPGRLKVQPVR